jgi:hypothetical protein
MQFVGPNPITAVSPVSATAIVATGLTGSASASRYVGATTSGHPTTGTFVIGDFVVDQSGNIWICTTAGSPGTWISVAGSGVGGSGLSATGIIGDGSSVNIPFSHNLGLLAKDDCIVQVINQSTFDVEVIRWTATDVNTVTIHFATAPATNSYRVNVVGLTATNGAGQAPSRILLGQLSTNFKGYRQLKTHPVMSGTFVARAASAVVYTDIRAAVLGGANAIFVLIVGTNGGLPNTPLYHASFQGSLTAASGATITGVAEMSLDMESINAEHYPLFLSGLTAGTTYTWQLVLGMAGGAQDVATVGVNPYYSALAPDSPQVTNTALELWVANNGDSSVEHVICGFRPNWRLGLTPMWASAGPPLPAGSGPWGIAVSPNGQYVAVCNQASKTVTAINAITHQVIGTSAALANSVWFPTFTQDSTVCWVGCSDGKVYPLTMSLTAAPTVGTGVLVNIASDQIYQVLCHPDGKTLWVADTTANKVYSATMTSNTTLSAFTAATGTTTTSMAIVRAAMTYGTVAAGVTLSATPFTLSVTSVFGAFPVQGDTIYVPISGGYATVTYTNSSTSGTTTTFTGCVGAGQLSVAGKVIQDKGVWIGGDGSAVIQHVPTPGGAVDQTITTAFASIKDIWVSGAGEELWVSHGNAAGAHTVEGFQAVDGQSLMAPTAPMGTGFGPMGLQGTSDGYVYVNLIQTTGKGNVFNWLSGTATITPTSGTALGQSPGKAIVSAEGVSLT